MSIPYYPGSLYTPVLGLSLFGMDEVLAENMVILDAAYGGGSSINVNGNLVENPNLSSTTPAAPGGQELVTFQYDSNGNISAYVPIPAAGGVTSFTGDSVVYNNAASTGAVSLSLIAQTKNTVLAGPTTGANAAPTFRALVAGDLPSSVLINPMTTLGDIIYGGASGTPTRLAGNTTTPREFLTSAGISSAATAPTWSALVSGDIPNNAANTTGTAANLSGTPALPNGTTATTQVATDATTLIATDAFVQNAIDAAAPLLGIPWFNLIDALDYNQVVPWYNNGSPFAIDTGISRISAGVLGIGTGAQGSIAGTLKAATVNAGTGFQVNSAATSGQYLRGNGTNFVSSAIQAGDIPSGTVLWNQIGNPSSALVLSMGTYGTTFSQTAAVDWTWNNTTAATSSTTNNSPQFLWEAQFWDGALSQPDNWTLGSALAAGTNAAAQMSLIHSSGSSGFASFTLGNTVNPVALQFDAIGVAATIDFATNTSWTLQFTDSNSANTDAQLIFAAGASLTLESGAATQLILEGNLTTQNAAAVKIQNANSFTGTSNQFICNIIGTFAPTSGSATFVGNRITTTINQTGSASGGYEVLTLQAVETALLGAANYLIYGQAGSAGTTTKFTLDNKGNVVQTIGTTSAIANSPSLTLTGSYESSASGPTYAADSWSIQDVLQAATLNGTSTLTFTHSGSSGVAAISIPGQIIGAGGFVSINLSGNILWEFVSPTLRGGSGQVLSWSSTAAGNGTSDTGLSRISGGIIGVGTGAAASIAGSIQCASIALNGAVASPTAGVYYSGGTAGVSAGPFAAITSIQTVGGIVTVLADVSDERLKDHTPYIGGLREILSITPIKYTWNTEGQKITGFSEDRVFVGFRAQDVQKAIPEAVTQSASNAEYLGLDDRPIVAAMINAFKEQQAQFKQQQAQIEDLKKKINELASH